MKAHTPSRSTAVHMFSVSGNDLVVSFKRGGTYVYSGAAGCFDHLVEADTQGYSVGSWVNRSVKGRYPSLRWI